MKYKKWCLRIGIVNFCMSLNDDRGLFNSFSKAVIQDFVIMKIFEQMFYNIDLKHWL